MNKQDIIPWHAVNDEIVLSWSAPTLIYNTYYELQGNATRLFGRSLSLAQGGYGVSNFTQQQTFDELLSHFKQIKTIVDQMLVWIEANFDLPSTPNHKISNTEQVLSLLPEQLIIYLYRELSDKLMQPAHIIHSLTNGVYDFVSTDQQKIITLLQRDVERVSIVIQRIKLWIESKESV